MPKKVTGLQELLVEELQDLYDAEKQLVRALPKMAKAASDEELGNALREHLEVTKGQVQRIEQCFESLEMRAKSKPCKGMKGIVEEGSEMLQEDLEDALMDSAIAGAGRKVEHYEMMGYESVASLAKQIGRSDVAQMLQETLREEMDADKMLAQISKRLLKEASAAGRMQESPRSQSQSRGSSKSGARASKGSRVLTDPEEIRQWAEERGARPACVQGTGGKGDVGMIRLEFGGKYGNDENLREISWDDWAREFQSRDLALLVQDKTAGGQKSNFNKLVSKGTAVGQSKPRTRTAR